MSVTLASQILSIFCPIPDLYTDIYIFGFHRPGNVCGKVLVGRLQSIANDSTREMHGCGGGGRGHIGGKKMLKCALKIILARNLLRQYEARSRIPVRFPVLQGTGKASSTYHAGVRPCGHDIDLAVDPK